MRPEVFILCYGLMAAVQCTRTYTTVGGSKAAQYGIHGTSLPLWLQEQICHEASPGRTHRPGWRRQGFVSRQRCGRVRCDDLKALRSIGPRTTYTNAWTPSSSTSAVMTRMNYFWKVTENRIKCYVQCSLMVCIIFHLIYSYFFFQSKSTMNYKVSQGLQ